ncbi:hypothetical protein FRC10_000281 [Ceratobasidium sp. 414]|nr:hypothetical protein FRC10_000281 [Ceratobasidium sp. 414]
MTTTVFGGRDYVYGYWVSLDKEAALRNIDPWKDEDEAALEYLADTLVHHILSHSVLTLESIIYHYFPGSEDPNARDDEDGFVIPPDEGADGGGGEGDEGGAHVFSGG